MHEKFMTDYFDKKGALILMRKADKHSKYGLISLIIFLFTIILMISVTMIDLTVFREESNYNPLLINFIRSNFIILFVIIINVIGILFGIIGVLRNNVKKIFSILGIILNGVITFFIWSIILF